ncbi:unnamed protein product [Allacma fusca]|uniref:Intimal thickness related receptor IRP domain-containing protein n=1 Tax=Allacma fusca TaxID=39272 RepID=A0A8J2LLN1_9HEXA|nr:unnamed protein product [Allacma fusca]
MISTVVATFLILWDYAPQIQGKVVEGTLSTHEKWAFVDRFCFLSIQGTFQYEIEYDQSGGNISLLMYPDLQWTNAYHNPKARTCNDKVNALDFDKRQMVRLQVGMDDSGCEYITRPLRYRRPLGNNNGVQNYTTRVVCHNARSFRSARERWWFICVSRCNGTEGLNLRYKFRMTNGLPGDYWYEHFSADEFYILPILTAYCFIYLFLLFSALLFAVELKCRQLLHVTYKLFLLSLGFHNIGIICLCLSYGRYATNGVGLPTLKLIGRMFEGLCEFVFIFLLLLLAKGYTVTRGRLRVASAIKLTVFLHFYFFSYGFLFFYQQYHFDPGWVLYIYESPAGYCLLVLRLIGWIEFFYAIFFTLKHYPEKASFYVPFFALYSLWFISGPVMIIIFNHVIDKWVREMVSVGVEHFIMFVGHVVFLALTRPSAANRSFPYHVRTTQVGAATAYSCNTNGHVVERVNDSHAYAPSYIDATGRTIDIFTVTGVLQGVAQPATTLGSPMDVFSVNPHNGSISTMNNNNNALATAPPLPALFNVPPPKYDDAFPHERPGQVAEMLKEDEEETDDGGEDADSVSSGPPPLPPGCKNRESVYKVDS